MNEKQFELYCIILIDIAIFSFLYLVSKRHKIVENITYSQY